MATKKRLLQSLRSRFMAILLAATLPFFILTNVISLTSYSRTRASLLDQLENVTTSLYEVFDTLLRTSVKTYLRSKIETAEDLIYYILDQNSVDAEAQQKIINLLYNTDIGSTGYFYAFDSERRMIFHPDKSIVGTILTDESPLNEQIQIKKGYLEYEWQNSYEKEDRGKALYMTYIPELDWYLTATSYRDDFIHIIDMDSINTTVNSIEFGNNGYSFVVAPEGEIVAHPFYSTTSDMDLLSKNNFTMIIDELFYSEDGYSSYYWRDSEDSRLRKKLVFSKHLKDFNWVIASTIYVSELYSPLTIQLIINLLISLILLSILLWFIKKIGTTIELPVSILHSTLQKAIGGDLKARTSPTPSGPLEIEEVGENLNRFLDILERRTSSLEATIDEKDSLVREIQHRINNNLQTISSMLNLQRTSIKDPDTIRILQEINNRVSVIGMVYDQMLQNEIHFKDDTLLLSQFLEKYITFFISSNNINSQILTIENNFEDVYIKRNAAISCGLIMNELLTTCLNLSRAMNVTGIIISITLSEDADEQLIFSFSDNIDSPMDILWGGEGDFLPYTLVNVLVNQLNGTVPPSSTGQHSREFRMVFPKAYPDVKGF